MTTTLSLTLPLPLPAPRTPVNVRPATAEDLPFIDALQKRQRKALGFLPTGVLMEKIERGEVLIAEEDGKRKDVKRNEEEPGQAAESPLTFYVSRFTRPLGYLIAADRYFKHDDVGIIYQMNVVPEAQRMLVGATMLAAQFDRSAWGCKLYCCWCAQDLVGANTFWESMGFVPLAFRAGSEKRARVHIFWQKRIRRGDTTTPWWFPSKSDAGAMREDRLVLPIPPGRRWDEEMPRVMPEPADSTKLEDRNTKPIRSTRIEIQKKTAAVMSTVKSGGLHFAAPAPPATGVNPMAQAKRERRPRVKADPKQVAAARELRDRWLEHVNAGETMIESAGKYDVSRTLPAPQSPPRQLAA